VNNDIKPSLIFQGIYAKYDIKDVKIQRRIELVFNPLIRKIIEKIPFEKRVVIMNPLIDTIVAYSNLETTNLRAANSSIKPLIKSLNIAISSATFEKSSGGVDKILHQAFFDDLVCDLGKTIKAYKSAPNSGERKKLRSKIEFLLDDYNELSGNKLQFMDVLREKVK
jgi:hypothetical protein